MFLTAGALKSIFLLVCHRLNGATIERFAMHRSKRLEAKSITDQMIRFRRPDPQRLCTVATSVDMPNFRLFPQLTKMQEIGCFNELHNPQNSSCKDILAKQFAEIDLLRVVCSLKRNGHCGMSAIPTKSRLTHNNNLFGAFDNVNV